MVLKLNKIIHSYFPQIKIILTSYDSKSFVANMIDIGAVSYIKMRHLLVELLSTKKWRIKALYRMTVMKISFRSVLD
jgi:hypothetical protein